VGEVAAQKRVRGLNTNVILESAKREAGIHFRIESGIAMDPRMRGDDAKGGGKSLLLHTQGQDFSNRG
jgi:hypothetical protein